MSEQPKQLALVTGASSGIGEAVCSELLGRGWNVVGVSRRPGNFDHLNYTHLGLDLSDLKNLSATIEKCLGSLISDPGLQRFALVNNAADAGLIGTVDSIDPMAMQDIYAVNVSAPTCLMGWLTRQNRPGLSRRIVNVSTGAAHSPFPGMCAYGNTKAALRMAGMVLASELDAAGADPDFTILSYEPGVVDTEMQVAARTSSVEILPAVGFFQKLANDGALVPPSESAKEIVDYLDSNNQPRFDERRFGS